MIAVEVGHRIILILWLHFFLIPTAIFIFKDQVQLVVQIMHHMLKIHHYMLGMCKMLAQVPLSMVLHGAHGVGPISFCFYYSGTVVC